MAGKKRTRSTLARGDVLRATDGVAPTAVSDGAATPDGVVWCTPLDPSSSPSCEPSRPSATSPAAAVALFEEDSPRHKSSPSAAANEQSSANVHISTPAAAAEDEDHNVGAAMRAVKTVHHDIDPAEEEKENLLTSAPTAHYIRTSKVIAPDVSGIRCLAVSPDSRELVCAREDGSLVRYEVHEFQNIMHFTMLRHSGGRRRRTMTRLHYIPSSSSSSSFSHTTVAGAATTMTVTLPFRLLASYLSGQLVVYDAATLFPLYVHPRSGGAVWDFAFASARVLYTAVASNAWHELELFQTKHNHHNKDDAIIMNTEGGAAVWRSERFRLELRRIVPGVSGAHRALTVTAAPEHGFMVGSDDAGHVRAWEHISDDSNEDDTHNNHEDKYNMKDNDHINSTRTCLRSSVARSLWTTRLPTGIALCCAVVSVSVSSLLSSSGTNSATSAFHAIPHSPANDVTVVVGTSTGDVVCVGARDGQLRHVFAQHRGPVTTILVDRAESTLYASGWHESLRAYRCRLSVGAAGKTAGAAARSVAWYPAEVKRRTHYHEATQLAGLGVTNSNLYHTLTSTTARDNHADNNNNKNLKHTLKQSHALQLLLSASRDGTILYTRPRDLFTHPAMYLTVTTQSFAFAARRNVLLHTRLGRVEAFHPDESVRRWVPVFAHTLASAFHLRGLWCDAELRYFCVATDERVVLVRVLWADGSDGTRVRRLEELLELPAGRGVLDVCFVHPSVPAKDNHRHRDTIDKERKRTSVLRDEGEEQQMNCIQDNNTSNDTDGATHDGRIDQEDDTGGAGSGLPDSVHVYVLFDDTLVLINPDMTGCPHMDTRLHAPPPHTTQPDTNRTMPTTEYVASAALDTAALELRRVVYHAATATVWVFARYATWQCRVRREDGTPQLDSARWVAADHGPFSHVATVSQLRDGRDKMDKLHACTPNTTASMHIKSAHAQGSSTDEDANAAKPNDACVLALGRSCRGTPSRRYYSDITGTPVALPATLPQDVQFIAELSPRISAEYAGVLNGSSSSASPSSWRTRSKRQRRIESVSLEHAAAGGPARAAGRNANRVFLGRFSKGLLVTTAYEWRMVSRMVVEAAFVMRGGRHVLVLERNLEKTLESLPLCWKVRRFAN